MPPKVNEETYRKWLKRDMAWLMRIDCALDEQAHIMDNLEWLSENRYKFDRLTQWIRDLQSGYFVNCVYCGHRYGPRRDTPVSLADMLTEHIEKCPEHPLSKAKEEIKQLRKQVARLKYALRRA